MNKLEHVYDTDENMEYVVIYIDKNGKEEPIMKMFADDKEALAFCKRNKIHIPTDIEIARRVFGWSQRELSERLQIPLRTIEDWERHRMKCPKYTERLIIAEIKRIAEALQNA